MRSMNLEYPAQPYSKVNRYNARASYALETIHSIINTSPFVHVSFNVPDNPFPMVLPMIGKMASFDRPSADTGDVLDLYVHGYVSSRVMNRSRDEAKGGEGKAQKTKGLPVTIAASHLDGLVMSLTPNTHDYNYRSAVLFGHAEVVTSTEEKLWAMELITNSASTPDRWRNTRVPPNGGEMSSTSILRIKIQTGSAKVRTGMPRDDKGDLEDERLLDRVWTGVIPVYSVMGEPVAREDCRVGGEKLPGYIKDFVRDGNSFAKENAIEVATKAMVAPKKVEDDD